MSTFLNAWIPTHMRGSASPPSNHPFTHPRLGVPATPRRASVPTNPQLPQTTHHPTHMRDFLRICVALSYNNPTLSLPFIPTHNYSTHTSSTIHPRLGIHATPRRALYPPTIPSPKSPVIPRICVGTITLKLNPSSTATPLHINAVHA
ncbi:hypothetical protein PIB30_056659 [Stylosanthes scabra]|uniref:Uncharacterized protein n=1 Tax=Stylosanthes scabra TaxID=79078 RepID=A0ABU6VIE2_9FABA|nr:hypothetical protein [Stylosanthes scabra]